MYEEKLKKEFFKKLEEWLEIPKRIEELEKETGLDWEQAFDELMETNEEYVNLLSQSDKICDEMNALLVRTKYFPLVGLPHIQRILLEIWKQTSKPDEHIEERYIEEYLGEMMYNLKDDMKERSKQLEPLLLTAQIDLRTYYLYREVISCYIYGAFEASCVLCRAITESIAKRYIKNRGYGHLLTGKDKEKMVTVPKILKDVLSMPKEIISLYSKIGNMADNILHCGDEKTDEEDSLYAIKKLQSFIKKFPKTL